MMNLFGNRMLQKQAKTMGLDMFTCALERARSEFPDIFKDQTPSTQTSLRQQRFEAISLTMSVVLWHLKQVQKPEVAQAAYDAMFLSFDRSMREGGVGDIGISHKIKNFAQAFHGRLNRYSQALEHQNCSEISEGLQKNMGLGQTDAEHHAQAILNWAYEISQNKNITSRVKS